MIENLKRSREPLAWIAIALTALGMGLGVWRLVTTINTGEIPVFAAFQDVSASLLNITVALVVVALVMTCSFISPATKRAVAITRAGAWVLTLGVLLTLVSTVMGMWASEAVTGVVLDVLGGLLDLAFKALAAGSLWVLLRGVKAGRIEPPAAEPTAPAADVAAPRPGSEPTRWSPDEAAGAVWPTAAQAADGVPGLSRMPEPQEPDEAN